MLLVCICCITTNCIKKWPNDHVSQLPVYYGVPKIIFTAKLSFALISHTCSCVCFFSVDDTYMYDNAVRGAIGRPHQGHWYDEPPYESDPDDFLMSSMNAGPAATIQVCLCNRSISFQHICMYLCPIYDVIVCYNTRMYIIVNRLNRCFEKEHLKAAPACRMYHQPCIRIGHFH